MNTEGLSNQNAQIRIQAAAGLLSRGALFTIVLALVIHGADSRFVYSVRGKSPSKELDARMKTATTRLESEQVRQPESKRTDLQRHDLSAPGREVIQVRVDFDPGYVSPRHTHPGEEIIYVLEGTLQYGIAGQPPRTVRPGDVLFVPAGAVHWAKNVGRGNGAELATYIVEKGKPLITVVSQ